MWQHYLHIVEFWYDNGDFPYCFMRKYHFSIFFLFYYAKNAISVCFFILLCKKCYFSTFFHFIMQKIPFQYVFFILLYKKYYFSMFFSFYYAKNAISACFFVLLCEKYQNSDFLYYFIEKYHSVLYVSLFYYMKNTKIAIFHIAL
jgi:hypothetical protein